MRNIQMYMQLHDFLQSDGQIYMQLTIPYCSYNRYCTPHYLLLDVKGLCMEGTDRTWFIPLSVLHFYLSGVGIAMKLYMQVNLVPSIVARLRGVLFGYPLKFNMLHDQSVQLMTKLRSTCTSKLVSQQYHIDVLSSDPPLHPLPPPAKLASCLEPVVQTCGKPSS